jgi:hypothetical protein
MAFISRLLGKTKRADAARERVERVLDAPPDTPRPVRGMVYREAYVVYESGYKRKCIVLDYNDTGVRVRFPTNELLPPSLTVHARSVGLVGPGEVIWQKGSEAGLRVFA